MREQQVNGFGGPSSWFCPSIESGIVPIIQYPMTGVVLFDIDKTDQEFYQKIHCDQQGYILSITTLTCF